MATVAKLLKLPPCAICIHIEGKEFPETAQYDFRMTAGTWAYGCEKHYLEFRMHTELGTGKGQKLEVEK